jgi:Protein of unknown function (DUF3551)
MKILVALFAMGAACALTPSTASAQTYPVCIRGCDFGNGDCSYSSYQQCQASAAGRTAWCDANPDYRPVSDIQTGRVKMSRRKL